MDPKDLSIVGELLLDPKNPRHPEISSQIELIRYFSRDTKILALAKDILENGLSPIERLLVFKDGDDFIVLEGNRRTAAVKLLTNPDLAATPSMIKRYKDLVKGKGHRIPQKAACAVSPDRPSANLWLARKHGGLLSGIGTVPWGAIQRERFDVGTGEAGQYPLAMAILDWLVLPISDDFPISTLSRLVKNPAVRKRLGYSLKDGELKISGNKPKLKKILKRISSEINSGDISTATIESAQDQIDIVNRVIIDLGADPNPGGDEKENGKNKEGSSAYHGKGENYEEEKSDKKSDKPQRSRTTVAPKNFKPLPVHPKSLRILNELKKINVNKFPIASAGAFRAFIEVAGLVYRQKAIGKKPDKNTNLEKVLEDINKHMATNSIMSGSELKKMNQFKSSIDSPISKDALNATLHNPQYTVDPESLRLAWDDMTPFISQLLEEI